MTTTTKHLVSAIVWLLLAPLVFIPVVSSGGFGLKGKFYAQVASLIWIVGFTAIFLPWAIQDAQAHGKSRKVAVLFSILWPIFLPITHFVYLLYTRGLKMGLVACVKFICFLLFSAILSFSSVHLLSGLFTRTIPSQNVPSHLSFKVTNQ